MSDLLWAVTMRFFGSHAFKIGYMRASVNVESGFARMQSHLLHLTARGSVAVSFAVKSVPESLPVSSPATQ